MHVDSWTGMNVRKLQKNQLIITTNPDIVESYIKFDDEYPFDINPLELHYFQRKVWFNNEANCNCYI